MNTFMARCESIQSLLHGSQTSFSKEIYVIDGIGVRHRQVEGLGIGAKVMNGIYL